MKKVSKKCFLLIILPLIIFTPIWAKTNSEIGTSNLKEIITTFKATKSETDAGAVVLENTYHVQSLGEGKNRLSRYLSMAILDDQSAEKFTQFNFGYNAFYDDLSLDFARVITKDGTIIEASADAIQDIARPSEKGFSDQRQLSLALPSLQPGSFLELQYTTSSKQAVLEDYFWYYLKFSVLQPSENTLTIPPVRKSTINVKTQASEILKFELPKVYANNLKTLSNKNGEYTWQITNIPSIPYEENTVSFNDKLPHIRFTTAPDWNVIDTWGKESYLSTPTSKTITDLASEITKGVDTKLEKTRKVFSYIQKNVRYISADFNRSGIIPHSPDSVLKNRYGDCKDQATLLVKMLNSLEIEAYPALINPFPRYEPSKDIPALAFSHIIVYVPSNEGDIWLDPSIPNNPFMLLSWTSSGQQAFILNGKGGELKFTPKSTVADNTATYENTYTFDDEKQQINMTMEILLTGDFDLASRMQLINPDVVKKNWILALKQMYPTSNIKSVEVPSLDHNEDKMFIKAQLEFTSTSDSKIEKGQYIIIGDISQILINHSRLLHLPQPEDRHHEYVQPYPFKVTINNHIKLPKNKYQTAFLEEPINSQTKFFSAQFSPQKNAEGLTTTSTFTVLDRYIPKEEYALFQQSLQDTIRHSKWIYLITNKKDSIPVAKQEVEKQPHPTGPLAKIQSLIDKTDFSEAKQKTEAFIKENKNNGEAYYKLGLILGSMNDFKASSAAFKKSKELGYTPIY